MRGDSLPHRLSLGLAGLMAVQAVLGLLFHGEYRDVAWIAATWWGNDAVILIVAVPLLAAAVAADVRGSRRGALVWAGSLCFAVYNYAYYLLGAALNRFFPLYLACLLLAVWALVALLGGLQRARIAAGLFERAPARSAGVFFMVVAAGLSMVWLGTWAAYAFAGRPTPVEPEAFKLVAALDLTLMVPLLAAGGALLFRRHPWGFLVAPMAGVQASVYLLVLTVNSVIAIVRNLVPAPGELPIWGTLLVATAGVTVLLLSRMRPARPSEPRRQG